MSRRRNFARSLTAAVLLAAATALLLLLTSPAPGHAQSTDVTYISNISQGDDGSYETHQLRAQSFNTGSQVGGYAVTHVDIGAEDGDSFSAAIYTANSSGHPVSEVAALTPPSSFATGTLTFTAPANTTLAASTTYSVRIVNSSSSASARLDMTSSNDEDAGGASGWSIGDNAHRKTSPTSGSWTARTASIRIAIRYNPPPNTAATGAPTISGTAQVGQTLTAATSGIADTDGLTSPGYTYQWIRVNGTDADISGATSSTYTLVAADQGKTIKVKVSFSDDASNAETLTSAATSAVAGITTYISNHDQRSDNEYISSLVRAQSFSTGSQTGGYTVTHVDIGSDDDEGDSFSAAIYTTNASGHPDSEVATLVPPSSFAKGDLTFTAPANTTLAASTTYTLRIVKSTSGNLTLDTTLSDNEDADGASGWSIGNVAHKQEAGGSWSDAPGSASIRIAIKGSTAVTANNAATGAPTISGTAQVGQTLTAATGGIMDSDGLTSPTYTYQWIRVGGTESDISGATSSTYTLVAADEGKTIKVTVSFTDDASNAETLTSAATSAVTAAVTDDCAGPATTTCSVSPGTPATGDIESSGDSDYFSLSVTSGVTYQIDAEGSPTSMGTLPDPYLELTTDSPYTSINTNDDGGTGVNARLTWTASITGAVYVSIYSAVAGDTGTYTLTVSANNRATGAPTISGTAQVGQTLTAATSGIMDSDGLATPGYTYQWIRVDGATDTDISGATSSSYTLVAADLGKTIKVKVSFSDDASNSETLTSAATAAVTAAVITTYISNIDQGMSSDYNTALPRAQRFSTGSRTGGYVVTSVDIEYDDSQGDRFSAAIYTTDASGHPDSEFAALTAPPSFPRGTLSFTAPANITLAASTTYTVRIVVAGSSVVKLDATLSDAEDNGTASGWSIANVAHSFSGGTWSVNTGGRAIRIAIKGSTTVAAANTPATGAPTISGTAQVGETLTADTSGIMDADGLGTFSYQWKADGADISGATLATYTLTSNEQGKMITVTVSFTDAASNAETLTSTATAVVTAAANNPATGAPTISGTAQVGQTLTAATSGIMDDGLTSPTYTYQWIRVDGATDTDISGATSSTYTLVAADLGKTIKVTLSFSDDASNAETLTSAATPAVAAALPGAPLNLSATAGDKAVMFTWGAPPNNGAPITAYRIRYKVSTATAWEDWVTVPTLSATVTGLTNDTSYDFEVQAQNSAGWSASATVSATPVAAAVDDCAGDTTSTCSVSPGTPVTGDIESSGDADYFSLSLTSGVTYQIDAEGSDTSKGTLDDPYLFLRNAAGTELASNEDGGTGRNARIVWTATTTETGYVDVQDSATTNTGTYTLTVSAANSPATDAPTISGTAVVGEPMRAVTSGIMDSDGLTSPTYTYQWIRVDGATESDISGATSSTYTPVAADLGKTIKVKVSFTDDASNAETLTSAATATVAAAVSTTVPVAIGNLAAALVSGSFGEVFLAWHVPDEGGAAIERFQVRRKGGTGSYGAWANIASSGATTHSHTVTGLVYGWPYAFQVRAVNSYGEGADSNEAMVRTPTDFEHLQNGHTGPFGMWSADGLALWVGRFTSREVRVYNLSSQDIQPSDQWRLIPGNDKPAGIWSDASQIYVLQAGVTSVSVYNLGDKSYYGFYPLNPANSDPRGIWSDGATVWVSDAADKKVYAYQLSSFNFDTSQDIDLHALHAKARDIWSDGDWMWVLDNTDKAAYAYRLDNGLRSPSQDIVLETSGRNYVSLWSDDTTLYALDNGSSQPGKIYERPLSDRGWVRPPTNTSTAFVNRASSSPGTSSPHRMRQRFTTGPNPNGYYLAVVGLSMNRTARLASVSIHSARPDDATQHHLVDLLVDQDGGIRYHRMPETAGTAALLEANTDYWVLVTLPDGQTTDIHSTSEEAAGLTFYTGMDGWKLHTKPGLKGVTTGWALTTRNATMSTQLNAWACVDEHCTNVLGHRPSAPAVAATRNSLTEVDLEWTAPASAGNHAHYAIERYLVERSTDGGSTWSELVRDLAPDATSYSDSESTAPISTRRYRVVAANVDGYTEDADRSAGVVPAGGEITLVSNIDQSPTTSADLTVKQAQAFTTGADAAFYTLHSVVVDMGGGNCEAALYTADSDGYPDTLHASLTRVGGSCNGKTVFTAPANTQLATSSTYTVQLSPVSGSVAYKTTTAEGEDSAGLAGWSIANKKARGSSGGGWTQPSAVALKVRIRGNPIDFGSLAASHTGPIGMWSPDGSTLWVGQWFSTRVYAYNLADETLDSGENWELHNPATAADRNRKPTGIWSNGTHIYVTDPDHGRVFQYNFGDKTLTSNTYSLHADNDKRQGLWSDGITAWVSDDEDGKLYAYALSDFSRDSGKDIALHADNGAARGIWSDGNTIWVLDSGDKKIYAYTLTGGSRDSGLDIDLDAAGENYNSIWSDGTTMYVVENTGGSASRDPQIHKLPLPASVLVSNAGQRAGANTGADTERAQTFRTGDNYHGYTLESVKLFTGNSVSVDLAVWTTDANGHPDALHATLTPPASFAAGEIEFTDPADSRLERNTTYALRISSPSSARLQLPITASSAEDASSKSGWSIGDDFLLLSSTTNAWGPSGTGWAYRVTIKGTPNPDTVPAAITGLRASGLDGGVALSWGQPDHGGPATSSYAVTSLTNDTEYTFQVRAVNAVGDAQPSNEATATPKADECGQGTSDRPCMLTVGTASAGAIQRQSDADWYQLDALADTTYQIDLKGAPSNSGTLADPFIGGLYTKGALVEFGLGRIPDTYNDDISSTNKDARVIWTAHRDITVFISVYSGDVIYIDSPKTLGIGTYTLTVTQLGGPPPPLSEPPPPAATRTLLSNFNVGERRIVTIMDPDPEHYDHVTEFSQPFTTGSNSQGYALGSIGLIGRDWLDGPPPLVVTLRSDSGGNPSSAVLATFTNSPSWKPVGPDGGLIFSIFRAPSGTTLNPNTKYHIHIQPTGRVKLETVEDSGETGGSLSGWDLKNSRRKTRNDPNWHRENNANQAVRLGVFGQVTGQQTAQAAATVRAPMIFIATAKGPAQVDLIWTTPEFGAAAGYGIQRSADGETGWQAVEPPDDGGDTKYRNVGLTPETTYHYRMRYLTEDGPGEWTYPVAATTASDAWQLTAAAVSKTQVDLSWTAPEEEFTGYYVEWSADGRTGWTATDPIHSGTEAGYSHKGLTVGTTYHYRVLAANGNIPGAWSPVVSATTEEADNTPATGAPVITGTAQVGQTLSADTSGIADADGLTNAVFSYQWLADGADIPGATNDSYTLTDSDEGKVISVAVTFTDDAGNDETLTSAATTAVEAKANTPATGAPAISGTAQVGETLTADVSGIADDDGLDNVAFSYQWLADGADISGATASTYTPVVDDIGKAITVTVSFTDDAGNAETLTSAATDAVEAKPNSSATGAPTISGTTQVGETLTADTSGIADDDGLTNAAYSYQWLADGAEISGATDSTHTLADADIGKAISVRVSFTDDAGHKETLTSEPTAEVAAKPNSPATGQPAITGTAQVEETLTADTSGIADADGLDSVSYSYQWLAEDAEISGATDSTYILASDDVGRTIKVRVSFTDDQGHSEELTSVATGTVEGAPSTPLTVSVENVATSHDGEKTFTFELRFSEELSLSYKTLRDHAFTVTGGTVKKAQRLDKPSNILWRITVKPDSDGDVTIILPITEDCNAQGAICTDDGRMLSNELVLTVSGP